MFGNGLVGSTKNTFFGFGAVAHWMSIFLVVLKILQVRGRTARYSVSQPMLFLGSSAAVCMHAYDSTVFSRKSLLLESFLEVTNLSNLALFEFKQT